MAGGSHTNFNTDAFSVGAVGGAGVLASALAAGVANLRATRQSDFLNWGVQPLRAALILSEQFRAQELDMLQRAVNTIAERDRTIADLQRQLKTAKAAALL